MRQIFALVTTLFFCLFSFGQKEMNLNCEILNRIVNDVKVITWLNITNSPKDTIIVMDSLGVFKNCENYMINDHIIHFEYDNRLLEFNYNVEEEKIQWKNHFLVYKFIKTKQYCKIYLYRKPLKKYGYIIYNLKKGKIVSIKYSLGQL